MTEGLNRASGFLRGELGRALSAAARAQARVRLTTSRSRHADKLTRLIDGAVKSDQHEARPDPEA